MTELDTARAAFKAWQADPIDLGWRIPVELVHALGDEVERVERKATTFAKLERKLGQVVHAQEEFNRIASEALEAAQARSAVQPVLAPQVTDATTWRALLLACDELTLRKVDGRAITTPEGWVSYFLNGAANASPAPSRKALSSEGDEQ